MYVLTSTGAAWQLERILLFPAQFYGVSQPFKQLVPENLAYLTSQQALADLNHFLYALPGLLRVNSIGKVVTVGGSYPGALSAWARLRYPQSVHAAWASSGPVQADYDFFGYMDVVAASLADEAVGGSSQCVASLESAFSAIVAGVKSSDASTRSATVQPFCICDNYSAAPSSLDAANVISTITNNIAYSVQYNEQLGAGLTVRDLCSVMGATQGQQAVQAYNTWYMKTTFKGASDCPAQCVDSRYSALLASQNVTSAQAEEAGVGVRSWYWQTCAEFSYFQTCEQNTACVFRGASALGGAVPMPYFTEVCTQDYAIPDVKTLVDATNEYFGGNSTVADRVVYTSGTVDPWHYLAVHHTIAPESPAVFIPGMSHCQDLHSEAPSDTPQLKAGRQQAVQHIKQWLQEE